MSVTIAESLSAGHLASNSSPLAPADHGTMTTLFVCHYKWYSAGDRPPVGGLESNGYRVLLVSDEQQTHAHTCSLLSTMKYGADI